MKKYVLFLAAVFFASLSFAQVLKINQMELNDDEERVLVREVQNGETVEMSTEGNFIEFDSDVFNTSDIQRSVSLKVEVFNDTEGIDISGCWGECNAPWNFDFEPMEILAGDLANLKIDYNTNDLIDSKAWVTCTFFVDDVKDFVFHIKFGEAEMSVKEPVITKNNVYPNPATSIVNIDYALNSGNAQVVFYNILGVSVHEQSLSGQTGTAKVNVSDFATGIYFYTIKVNGKSVETKKLIINR